MPRKNKAQKIANLVMFDQSIDSCDYSVDDDFGIYRDILKICRKATEYWA